ncbi:hypothetical protein E2C01_091149 [Portunus trituberculatus]|uniref:Uncharacterized protein n=1 Tax=Portunus trituberculatus TaxID=210409 RepID=A0A5B7JGM2_PORTR|nr:hypothetical protein [Portunus trituberculatus]
MHSVGVKILHQQQKSGSHQQPPKKKKEELLHAWVRHQPKKQIMCQIQARERTPYTIVLGDLVNQAFVRCHTSLNIKQAVRVRSQVHRPSPSQVPLPSHVHHQNHVRHPSHVTVTCDLTTYT